MNKIKFKAGGRVKTILLSLMLFVFSSCNKDNSNPIITDSGLIGTWVATNVNGSTPQGAISVTPGLLGIAVTIIFRSDNSATLMSVLQGQATTQNYTWITYNGTILCTPTSGGIVVVLPYTQAGNKINVGFTNILPSINYNGVVITSLVLEFTKQTN